MTHGLDATALTGHLLAASLEGAAVVALVWIALRLMPAVSPAVRSALWWLAALKFVIGVLPVPAVSLPVLPAALRSDAGARAEVIADGPAGAAHTAPSEHVLQTDRHQDTAVVAAAATSSQATPVRTEGLRSGDAIDRAAATAVTQWRWIVLAVWVVIVGGHAIRIAGSARSVRRLVARAVPWSAEQLAAHQPLIDRLGLRRVPEVRTSADVAAPLVAGIRRPVVLIPAGEFAPGERAMMLCHELAHVRRGDVAWGWIPAAAERLFFFHPLAHLAAREYLVAREAACDAAVVRALDVAAADYARLLVKLGVSPAPPAMVAGGSSRSASSLRRRLEMLHLAPATRSYRSAWTIVLAAAALLPLQLGARQAPLSAAPATAAQRPLPSATARAARVAIAAVPAQAATRAVLEQSAARAVSGRNAAAGQEQPAATPAVAAMLHAVEQRDRADDMAARIPLTRAQEVLHVQDDQAVVRYRDEIERSLQALQDEYERVRNAWQARAIDERARAEAEIARTAAEQSARNAALQSEASEAARLQSERAAREVVRQQSERAGREVVRLESERAAREIVRAQAADGQLAVARARLAELERKGIREDHPDLFRAREEVRRLELAAELGGVRDITERARGQLRDDLERLRVQQEALARQLQQLAEQQQTLLEMQQRLADEAARIRREVER